jgi:hypothetical protein
MWSVMVCSLSGGRREKQVTGQAEFSTKRHYCAESERKLLEYGTKSRPQLVPTLWVHFLVFLPHLLDKDAM